MPQMHWTMWCTGTEEIAFSAIMGAKEPKPQIIKHDHGYMAELIERSESFIKHVHDLTEPVTNPYLKPPKPVFSRVVDMTGSNAWAEAAAVWLENKMAHEFYEDAAKQIKKLVPADAKEAFGYDIRVARNKAGSLSIKREQDNGTGEGTS
jgi:hypothetical protein